MAQKTDGKWNFSGVKGIGNISYKEAMEILSKEEKEQEEVDKRLKEKEKNGKIIWVR